MIMKQSYTLIIMTTHHGDTPVHHRGRAIKIFNAFIEVFINKPSNIFPHKNAFTSTIALIPHHFLYN